MAASTSRRRWLLGAAALAAALAIAAIALWPPPPESGSPELRSLASAAESREYGRAFWLALASEGGLTWRLALAYCRDPRVSRLPNCRNVLDAERTAAVPRPAPTEPTSTSPEGSR